MSKTLLLITLLLIGVKNFSQSGIIASGSYFIGMICKDGTVMGVDSRGEIHLPGTNQTLCYFDSIQKIFVIQNCIMVITGLVGLRDTFMTHFVKDYEKSVKNEMVNLVSLLTGFRHYLVAKSIDTAYINKLQIYSCQYLNKPGICALADGATNPACSVDMGGFISDGLTNFGSNKKYDAQYCINHTCKQIASLIRTEICYYAKKYNKTDKIGGPIMVSVLYPSNKIGWIYNKPKNPKWTTICQLMKKNKNLVHFTSNNTKKTLDEIYSSCSK